MVVSVDIHIFTKYIKITAFQTSTVEKFFPLQATKSHISTANLKQKLE